jgi:nucleoside-diphosphate-sugar epimerase
VQTGTIRDDEEDAMAAGTAQKRVVILGGHGKVALLAAPRLRADGFVVDSVIRDEKQSADVEQAGGTPVVLDIEHADVDELARVFEGAAAVVFSAGAGGGNPARTEAVDHQAAVRAIDAAKQAGVAKFVIVSYATVSVDPERVDPDDSFYPYVEAKHAADAYLRESGLDYTILGPGGLTLEPATTTITVADAEGKVDGEFPTGAGANNTSRDNVAAVIAHVLSTGAASRETVNFYDGTTPIADAVR